MFCVNISDLAVQVGVPEVERTLPNGVKVRQKVWGSEHATPAFQTVSPVGGRAAAEG